MFLVCFSFCFVGIEKSSGMLGFMICNTITCIIGAIFGFVLPRCACDFKEKNSSEESYNCRQSCSGWMMICFGFLFLASGQILYCLWWKRSLSTKENFLELESMSVADM